MVIEVGVVGLFVVWRFIEKFMSINSKKFFISKEGLKDLEKEYELLISERRKEVALRIQKARELGDITENAEYDSALDEQAFVESRIAEISEMMKNMIIIEKSKDSNGKGDVVKVGSHVKVHLEGQEQEFQIVGEIEADPFTNKISHESPLGSSLLGKKIGDKVLVEAPVGDLTYTVMSVR